MIEKTEIQEGNKLIAEFMQLPLCDVWHCSEEVFKKAWRVKDDGAMLYYGITPMWIDCDEPQFLHYHSHWDWIMPVVGKVRDSTDENVQQFGGFEIFELGLTATTETIWKAIVAFLKRDK
jgi:hypothetical protein